MSSSTQDDNASPLSKQPITNKKCSSAWLKDNAHVQDMFVGTPFQYWNLKKEVSKQERININVLQVS